jgi:hypothetical protein
LGIHASAGASASESEPLPPADAEEGAAPQGASAKRTGEVGGAVKAPQLVGRKRPRDQLCHERCVAVSEWSCVATAGGVRSQHTVWCEWSCLAHGVPNHGRADSGMPPAALNGSSTHHRRLWVGGCSDVVLSSVQQYFAQLEAEAAAAGGGGGKENATHASSTDDQTAAAAAAAAAEAEVKVRAVDCSVQGRLQLPVAALEASRVS